jgi:hypothetical protein
VVVEVALVVVLLLERLAVVAVRLPNVPITLLFLGLIII